VKTKKNVKLRRLTPSPPRERDLKWYVLRLSWSFICAEILKSQIYRNIHCVLSANMSKKIMNLQIIGKSFFRYENKKRMFEHGSFSERYTFSKIKIPSHFQGHELEFNSKPHQDIIRATVSPTSRENTKEVGLLLKTG
jgi:hypothetical protein